MADKRASARTYRMASHARFRNLLHTRIGKAQGIRAMLGEQQWLAFARHARERWKPTFDRCIRPGAVSCRGLITGGTCPYAGRWHLQDIHCDHTVDLNRTCSAWRAAHAHTARLPDHGGGHPWGFGLKRKRLLRLLFGIGTGAIVFRCKLCHSKSPHYENHMTRNHLLRRVFRQRGTQRDPVVLQ